MTTTTPTTKTRAKKTTDSVALEATIYSQKGAKAGTIALPASVFATKWNADLVHQVVVSMMSNKRAGTAHTKDRGEVSGGGKKPWKQKGTGRARHGSSRSPIWVGGGITFGPRNEKDYSKKINKKTRVKALYTLLSKKFALGDVLFVDKVELDATKTKEAQAVLSAWAKIDHFEKIDSKKRTGALMVLPERDLVLEKSFANLPGVTVISIADLNAVMLTTYKYLVMVNPGAVVPVLEAKMK